MYHSKYQNIHILQCHEIIKELLEGEVSAFVLLEQLSLTGPRHEKNCLCNMWTTKAQISLRIRAVWSAPLLFTA